MPPSSIKILPDARDDIQNTTAFLNEQRPQLGNQVFISVAEVIDVLRTNPLIFQKKYQEIRQAPLKKFSYLIHYIVDENEKVVIILSVLHSSRNPQIWKGRSL